jgi:two-component system phosphate regulon sensor histidine kinase PhoR
MEDATAKEFPLPQGLIDVINETKQGFIIEDTQGDDRWTEMPEENFGSAMVMPLFGRTELLGILILAHELKNYFNIEHMLLLQAITSQAAIAVENAQLYATVSYEQKRLAAVLQGAADAILMFDANEDLALVNPAGERLFTDYETRVGIPLKSGWGYDPLIELLKNACGLRVAQTGEITWPDKRTFSALVTPIDEGGCVAVLHDVTHFKNLEQVKNEFIATASHDLKTPIASISGFSALMAQAGPLNDQQIEFIDRIQTAAKNMNELVQNMLELVQIDLETRVKSETVDLCALVSEVADEFQPQAESRGLSLTFTKNRNPFEVQGDLLRLRQMVRNLVGNAIKYTPAGGCISLAAERQKNTGIFRVKDTGTGIPKEDLPFIFDRFYRAHNQGTNGVEGNGLGLAIVKSIVEQHGGQVSVESEVGKGSCFTVSLPTSSPVELNGASQTSDAEPLSSSIYMM